MSKEEEQSPWSEAKYKETLLVSRPRKIQDLWGWDPFSFCDTDIRTGTGRSCDIDHLFARDLFIWATESEIEELLYNEQELKNVTFNLLNNMAALGQRAERNNLSAQHGLVLVPPCTGCSNPCDAGFSTCGGDRRLQRVTHDPILHKAIIQCTVLSQLLTHEKSDLLCTIVSKEFPSSVRSYEERFIYIDEKMKEGDPQGFLPCLVANFDNLTCFPKLCHVSGGLLSLIVARRPAASFDILGELMFHISITKYIQAFLPLICNNNCIVDEYFGIVAYLNILPLLYMMGSWKAIRRLPEFNNIAKLLIHVIENVCYQITEPNGDREHDARPDLEKLPETRSAQILIEPLERRTWRKELLTKHPLSFLVIAGIEVLGWFSHSGVNFNNVYIEMNTGEKPDIPEALGDFKEKYYELIGRVKEYEYIKPILDALIDRKKAPVPDCKLSLLNGPLLDSCKRCALPTCRKSKKDIGFPLSRCAGNCAGLVYYCCKEHQKAHWKYHKNFCKNCWEDTIEL